MKLKVSLLTLCICCFTAISRSEAQTSSEKEDGVTRVEVASAKNIRDLKHPMPEIFFANPERELVYKLKIKSGARQYFFLVDYERQVAQDQHFVAASKTLKTKIYSQKTTEIVVKSPYGTWKSQIPNGVRGFKFHKKYGFHFSKNEDKLVFVSLRDGNRKAYEPNAVTDLNVVNLCTGKHDRFALRFDPANYCTIAAETRVAINADASVFYFRCDGTMVAFDCQTGNVNARSEKIDGQPIYNASSKELILLGYKIGHNHIYRLDSRDLNLIGKCKVSGTLPYRFAKHIQSHGESLSPNGKWIALESSIDGKKKIVLVSTDSWKQELILERPRTFDFIPVLKGQTKFPAMHYYGYCWRDNSTFVARGVVEFRGRVPVLFEWRIPPTRF